MAALLIFRIIMDLIGIDYYDLINITLNTISKIDSCNWCIKSHPAEKGLGKTRLKDIFQKI